MPVITVWVLEDNILIKKRGLKNGNYRIYGKRAP